jgi:DNA-binding NtrC family response regulator
MDHDARQPFLGRRLLIVEDELLIALELQHTVEQLGGTVVGPAGSVEGALQLLSDTTPNAALLDVTLREGRVTPVAQACRDRSVPFALVTGYGRLELDEPLLQSAPRVRKPFDSRAIHKVLALMLNTDRENPDFRTDTIAAARAGARRGTIL